jgi:broad specificity phosphatase PhoE
MPSDTLLPRSLLPGALPLSGKTYYGPNNPKFPVSGGLLLIRHSARPPIRSLLDSYFVGLTEAGKAMAYDFGKQIAQTWTIGEVVASPAGRCMDTGDYLLRGAANGISPRTVVRPLKALHFDQTLTGLPGLSQVVLDDHGFTNLISKPETPEYELMRDNLLKELPIPLEYGTLNVAVTHDVIVSFLQASLLCLPSASVYDFPDFLEGIFLVRDGEQIRLA